MAIFGAILTLSSSTTTIVFISVPIFFMLFEGCKLAVQKHCTVTMYNVYLFGLLSSDWWLLFGF